MRGAESREQGAGSKARQQVAGSTEQEVKQDSHSLPLAPCSVLPASCSKRMPGIDLARLAAAYSIIWLHAPHCAALDSSRAIGRFAVPLFVMITILMVFQSLRAKKGTGPICRNGREGAAHKLDLSPFPLAMGRYAGSRILRLYLPFMAWNGIYLAFKLLKGRLLPGEPNDYPGVDIFWFGACWHLWFLPFILIVSLAAFAVARLTLARPDYGLWLLAVSLLFGCILTFMPPDNWLAGQGEYWQLVCNALPAVAWGLGLAIAGRVLGTELLKLPAATLLGGMLLVAGTACAWQLGHSRVCETLAGLGVLIVAMAPVEHVRSPGFSRSLPPTMGTWCPGGTTNQRGWQQLAGLGSLAFGIYLVHVLWLKVIETVAVKSGAPNAWPRDVAIFLAAALASTATAWLLSRRPATRWLVA
jgi:surface polysaccharide O-acyltransferase-like enzyme